jgi:hypothetical protein
MGEWLIPEKEPVIFTGYEPEASSEGQVVEVRNRKYLILDAALWDADINPTFGFGNEYSCLFATRGAEHELNGVAPYLFEYEDDDELSRWVKYKETTGLRALYISSILSLEQLRKHFRRFLRVKREDGGWLFLRIFDPYVLNCVLPNLTQTQMEELLTPIGRVITEDRRINERRTFYLSANSELQIDRETINHVDNK